MAAGSSPVMPYGVLSEEDKQCSEKDLRFIAVKLADYDVSASMVSWSLQVTLDTTATATTCPLTHCDEIRQLLFKWKLQSPETGATRRQMLDFLHKLHKPSLLGEIEKYFGIERQSPSSLVARKLQILTKRVLVTNEKWAFLGHFHFSLVIILIL